MGGKEEFSGWKVALGCFLIMFMAQGGIQTFAVFMTPLAEGTNNSLIAISMISTIATAVAFLLNMASGTIMQKISIKGTLTVGMICLVGYQLIFAASDSLILLYVAAAISGISVALGTVAPCTTLITNWFHEKRATIISFCVAGAMFGSTVLNPIVGRIIASYGWRTAYLVLASAELVIIAIAIFFLISDSPEKKHQLPYGYKAKNSSQGKEEASLENNVELPGISLGAARKTASFWILMFGIILIGISTNIENFIPSFWQSEGLSVATSSSYFGAYSFIAAVASIILGRVNDRLGAKAYVLLTSSLCITGIITLATAGISSAPIMVAGMALFAIGGKKVSTMTPPMVTAGAFGYKHYSKLIGYFAGMLQLGIAISNPIIGQLREVLGFQKMFYIMAGLGIVAFLCIQLALRITPYKVKR